MPNCNEKEIPILEGAWTTPSSPGEQPQLLGSHCPVCGEVYFPPKRKGICLNCQHPGLEEIKLSRRGKISTFSVVMQQPGGDFYKGGVPYAFGYINLPDGVRLETQFTHCDFETLTVGMDVELVIEKLYEDDEGNDIITFSFKPV